MLNTKHTQFLLNRQENHSKKNNAKEDEEKVQPNGEKNLYLRQFSSFFRKSRNDVHTRDTQKMLLNTRIQMKFPFNVSHVSPFSGRVFKIFQMGKKHNGGDENFWHFY